MYTKIYRNDILNNVKFKGLQVFCEDFKEGVQDCKRVAVPLFTAL